MVFSRHFSGRRLQQQLQTWTAGGWLQDGRCACVFLLASVLLSGLEAAYVQAVSTNQIFSFAFLGQGASPALLLMDLLVPLVVALLSRRLFLAYLVLQTVLSSIILHYSLFFYNPLTLSTIYHSMQGAGSLGSAIFIFARVRIILAMACVLLAKILLVLLSMLPDRKMPRFWGVRGFVIVLCLAVVWGIAIRIYGETGLSLLWVDSSGHRTATERRLESGTKEAVRTIGYVATWMGEWFSGTYKDTALIYAEARCAEPEGALCASEAMAAAQTQWCGLPVPPLGPDVALIQVESLDFAALGLQVNGHAVLPFLESLLEDSLLLKTFAPHKVGSSNSDYELLNGRIAEQNVIYYSYIEEYPDSIFHMLEAGEYAPTVIHGLGGRLFNLRNAYAAQGIQRFFFQEELTAAGYEPSPHVMGHIADADVFDKAAQEMELPGKHAQFIITMSSHIPFMEILPIFQGTERLFGRYISSLRYMDQCLAAYYARLPEGTLMILWGDHGSDIPYPRGYADNRRHVPFLVHVKGNRAWLDSGRAAFANTDDFTGTEDHREAAGGIPEQQGGNIPPQQRPESEEGRAGKQAGQTGQAGEPQRGAGPAESSGQEPSLRELRLQPEKGEPAEAKRREKVRSAVLQRLQPVLPRNGSLGAGQNAGWDNLEKAGYVPWPGTKERIYTLCELHYYLRRILQEPGSGGKK